MRPKNMTTASKRFLSLSNNASCLRSRSQSPPRNVHDAERKNSYGTRPHKEIPGAMAEELEVLFVDDEDSIRLTLPLMLQTFGFKVTAAANVGEALRLISERKFDVLLSDLNIERPGDGFTVVSAMKSIQPNAVRLILTGYPDIDTAVRAM